MTAGNRLARHLLRTLRHLMTKFKFRLYPAYIRTYHNTWTDDVTRLSEADVEISSRA